jgi:hypothetical protein
MLSRTEVRSDRALAAHRPASRSVMAIARPTPRRQREHESLRVLSSTHAGPIYASPWSMPTRLAGRSQNSRPRALGSDLEHLNP